MQIRFHILLSVLVLAGGTWANADTPALRLDALGALSVQPSQSKALRFPGGAVRWDVPQTNGAENARKLTPQEEVELLVKMLRKANLPRAEETITLGFHLRPDQAERLQKQRLENRLLDARFLVSTVERILNDGERVLNQQEETLHEQDSPALNPPPKSPDTPKLQVKTGVSAPTPSVSTPVRFWPELDGPALTWFAIVVILLLTLQANPIFSLRNLDGLVLAATCLLLVLRFDTGPLPKNMTGKSVQWWTYLVLSVIAGYWLIRGVQLLMARYVPASQCNVSKPAMLVLVLAGLAVSIGRIATAPLSPGSNEALVGGLYTAQSGKLPYGETIGNDTGSPLLYLLHAGAIRARPLTMIGSDARSVSLKWDEHEKWLNTAWWENADLTAARLVNGVLFVAVLGGLLMIGRRLHSTALGMTMLMIFCVFPGTTECLNRPEIMLPAALLTWTLAFALLPGVGGLLSMLFLVLAGLAWPWAWLALPILLFYFLRQGWQGAGAVLGLLGGAALCVAGLTWLAVPSLPRVNGALSSAGMQADYVAKEENGALVIQKREPQELVRQDFKAGLWKFLIERESTDLSDTATALRKHKPTLPTDLHEQNVLYRSIQASGPARTDLQKGYQEAIAGLPAVTRMWVALRTTLEATWLPETEPKPLMTGAWSLWAGNLSEQTNRWLMIRRGAKIAVGLFSLVLAFLVYSGRRTEAYHLVGALLAVTSAALLVSESGAVMNLVWFAPIVLAVLAAHGGESPRAITPSGTSAELEALPRPPAARLGPAPRISIES